MCKHKGPRGARAAVIAMSVAFAAVALRAEAQAPDFSKVEYRAEKLTDNLHVLFGGGGNIAVLTGPDGALVVDSDVVEMSAKLRGALALVSDKPLKFLVNTHFHFDHAGSNATLGRSGMVIVAHENVRKHLTGQQVVDVGVKIVTEAMQAEGLPMITFDQGVKFHVNDETVTVNHVAHAHTDSDAFVYFPKANVLHMGDLFMSIGYPFVDAGNGGSSEGLAAAHARALALANDGTRIIPGHGPVVGKGELQAYHQMLVTVRQRIAELVRRGRTLEQIKAAAPSKEFDERWGKGFVTPEVFVQRIFIELNRPAKKR